MKVLIIAFKFRKPGGISRFACTSDFAVRFCFAFSVDQLTSASENGTDSDFALWCVFRGEGNLIECEKRNTKMDNEIGRVNGTYVTHFRSLSNLRKI